MPTLDHPMAAEWAADGGPWDIGPLAETVAWAGAPRAVLVDPSDGTRLDRGALLGRARELARWLAEAGAGPGRAVMWQAPNWWESVVLYLACWRAGAVAVPLHHRAGAADVEAARERIAPAVLLSAADLPAAAAAHHLLRPGGLATEMPAPSQASRDSIFGPVDPASPAVVLHTSGSSGPPKAVVHTHRTLGHKARQMVGVHGLGPADAVLMPAPLAHVSGLLNGILVPGAAGMTTVLMDRWSPDSALQLVEDERITFMVGPPTFFLSMAAAPGFRRERVASLRLISSGGAGVSAEFARDATVRFAATVKRTYGSTEAPTVTTSRISDPPDRAAETDGRPTPHTEIEVVDGELWVRGPEVCAGYLDAEITTSAFTSDGWFRTGDRASIGAEGWLTLTGRRDDLIIRGGENVSAAEVEALLESHPGIRQAVVVAVPDEQLGERVAAVIVAAEDMDVEDCRTWFTAKGAARYKAPEVVVRVTELPSLASGKPDRQAAASLAVGE